MSDNDRRAGFWIMAEILLLLLVLIFLVSGLRPEKAKAGIIGPDESLGGWSYLADCAYNGKIPEGRYLDLIRKAQEIEHNRMTYKITSDEHAILCRIVEAEATGGNVEQKKNVASCVLARVESKAWPNNIEGVVFQNDGTTWQFSPISDGRYFKVSITETTKEAVDWVLKYGKTHDCLWFCSDGSYNKKNEKGEYCSYHRLNHTWVFFDGEHHYFYD